MCGQNIRWCTRIQSPRTNQKARRRQSYNGGIVLPVEPVADLGGSTGGLKKIVNKIWGKLAGGTK